MCEDLANEKAMFALFRTESTDEYKRMVIYLVRRSLRAKQISLNRLKSNMGTYGIPSEDVEAALGGLVTILAAARKFHVQTARKPDVYQVSVQESEKWEAWASAVEERYPEFTTLADRA